LIEELFDKKGFENIRILPWKPEDLIVSLLLCKNFSRKGMVVPQFNFIKPS